jgi:repressor of nif and glnA expression
MISFTTRNVRKLILQILAESREPMSRKYIAEKIGKLVELTSYYLEPTPKTKIPRWKAIVLWEISHMKKEDLIKTVDKGLYIITEKGRKMLEEMLRQ